MNAKNFLTNVFHSLKAGGTGRRLMVTCGEILELAGLDGEKLREELRGCRPDNLAETVAADLFRRGVMKPESVDPGFPAPVEAIGLRPTSVPVTTPVPIDPAPAADVAPAPEPIVDDSTTPVAAVETILPEAPAASVAEPVVEAPPAPVFAVDPQVVETVPVVTEPEIVNVVADVPADPVVEAEPAPSEATVDVAASPEAAPAVAVTADPADAIGSTPLNVAGVSPEYLPHLTRANILTIADAEAAQLSAVRGLSPMRAKAVTEAIAKYRASLAS